MTTSIVYVNTTGVTVTLSTNQGPQGATGTAASIAVGSTTTGSAGSSAAVTNSGTSTAAVLDFTIPTGPTGPTGATGAAGVVQSITGTAPITVGGTAAIPVIGITQGSLTIAESQVTNLVTDLAAKAPLASPTFTGTLTTPIAVVTGSTVPTNGVYLPAANTLGLATNSAVRMQIDSNGNVGIGSAIYSTVAVRIAKSITGGVNAYGLALRSAIQSDVTTRSDIYLSNPDTTAASFTLTILNHFAANGVASLGAGSAITNQYGFWADAGLTAATNNYGFLGNIAAGTARWNFHAQGTAANYFAGQTTVGSTSLTLGSGSVAQQFGVVSSAATNIVEVIRGAASQSGDLTQWQNSAGTILANIDSSGLAYLPNGLRVGSASVAGLTFNGISNPTGQTGLPSLIVKGITSQTANLQEWHTAAGSVVASIDTSGQVRTVSVLNINSFNNSRVSLASTGTTIDSGITTNVVLIVKATNASQTANLQQWASSSATLTAITSAGTINFASGNTSATATIGAITPPVMVSGYITMQIAGTTVKVPYYNN